MFDKNQQNTIAQTTPSHDRAAKDGIKRRHLRNESISAKDGTSAKTTPPNDGTAKTIPPNDGTAKTTPQNDQTAKTTPQNDQTAKATPLQKEPFRR
jgi:hypothetical protein